MKIEIPDEWLSRHLNFHPDIPIEEAMRMFRRNKELLETISRRMLYERIGQFVMEEAEYEKS